MCVGAALCGAFSQAVVRSVVFRIEVWMKSGAPSVSRATNSGLMGGTWIATSSVASASISFGSTIPIGSAYACVGYYLCDFLDARSLRIICRRHPRGPTPPASEALESARATCGGFQTRLKRPLRLSLNIMAQKRHNHDSQVYRTLN